MSGTCTEHGDEQCASCNLYRHRDGPAGRLSCVENACTCSHGAAVAASACEINSAERCAECDLGYVLTGASGGPRFCSEIGAAVCVCANGTPERGAACSTDSGDEQCESCNDGFWRERNSDGEYSCSEKSCTCANGQASTGSDCDVHGAEACTSCEDAYHLEGETGAQHCQPNLCRCDFGEPKASCLDEHNKLDCETCDPEFDLTSNEDTHYCRPAGSNTCLCPHGTPNIDTSCSTSGAIECAECHANYHLEVRPGGSVVECVINTCVCEDGEPESPTACDTHGATECAACDIYFHLSGSSGAQACVANQCVCAHGETDDDTCMTHSTTNCKECHNGYFLTGNDGEKTWGVVVYLNAE